MTKKEIVNAKDVKTLIGRDELFARIHEQYGVPPNWSREPGFASLSKIILEQQVSLASADAHFKKLHAYIGDFLPVNILQLTDEEMRSCQISRQKMVYLRALSESIVRGDMNLLTLDSLTEPEVRQRLTGIKGIGHWTTDVYLLFCLQAKDIFPIGDIAIVNTVRELTPAHTQEEILALAERWRPLRSLAAYFLWLYYLKKRKRL